MAKKFNSFIIIKAIELNRPLGDEYIYSIKKDHKLVHDYFGFFVEYLGYNNICIPVVKSYLSVGRFGEVSF